MLWNAHLHGTFIDSEISVQREHLYIFVEMYKFQQNFSIESVSIPLSPFESSISNRQAVVEVSSLTF